jgi:hypothetical protein
MFARSFALMLAAAGSLAAEEIKLDRLLAGPERSEVRWAVSVPQPVLTPFQRLYTRISMRVDGKEIVKRNGNGEFLFAAEFRDSSQRVFHTQIRANLPEHHNATAQQELECAVQAFVLPGVYDVSLAVVETTTEKVSLTHRTLRVPPLSGDPLPDLWQRLPEIEFVDVVEPPDDWYLPRERGRLSLTTGSEHPQRLEILANITPTEVSRRQTRAYNRTMEALLPSLKVLSRIDVGAGSKHVALVDVGRRTVRYEQDVLRRLDWMAMKEALHEADPNKIDAAALKDRSHNASFFVDQADKRATPATTAGGNPVLVVLSGPLAFTSHQDIQQVQPPPNTRVFYLRFEPLPSNSFAIGPNHTFVAPNLPIDDLERTLKPLQPKLFDIYSPMDFRRALAAIVHELGR